MHTIDKFDPKTGRLTITFQLNATPRETDKYMMYANTPGWTDLDVKVGNGKVLRMNAQFGHKK